MGKELKTIGFAATVCIVCSLLLAAVYSSLREEIELNKALDLKLKVLQAFGEEVKNEKGKTILSPEEIQAIFTAKIEGHVLNASGVLLEDVAIDDLTPEQINERDPESGLKAYYPYFVYTDTESGTRRYAIHVSGMGLWSVIKGYMALENDYGTVAGIAFYDHAETPGLGGEIDKQWFTDQFKGKLMAVDKQPKYFRVVKPGMALDASAIQGPSGSTMTSKGLEAFLNADYAVYNTYFRSLGGS